MESKSTGLIDNCGNVIREGDIVSPKFGFAIIIFKDSVYKLFGDYGYENLSSFLKRPFPLFPDYKECNLRVIGHKDDGSEISVRLLKFMEKNK